MGNCAVAVKKLCSILVVLGALVSPASASGRLLPSSSARLPLADPRLQIGTKGWIIWETETPVQRLALDGNVLWVGHDKGGLSQWSLATGLLATYSTADGLSGDDVLSIAVDGSGDVWLALLDGGVDRTANGSSYDDMTPPEAVGAHPWVLDADGGDIWLGTLGGGVARRTGGSWTAFTPVNSNLPFDDIYAVASGGGEVWVGTIGYGVAALDGADWVRYDPPLTIPSPRVPFPLVNNRAITDIAIDGSGRKWFASDGSGVAVLDAANADWTIYDSGNSGLASNFVQSVFLDGSGNRWFGTLGGGVSRLSAGGGWLTYNSRTSPFPEDDVLEVVVDSSGGVWLAAYDTGLAFFGDLPGSSPSFDLDPRGAPSFIPGAARGYFLSLEPDTFEWTLAWSGDGREHRFQGELVADGALSIVAPSDLEPGDTATADAGRLIVDAREATGKDGVTFALGREVTRLDVDLRIDGVYYPYSFRVGAAGAAPGTAPFRLLTPQPVAPVVNAGDDVLAGEGDLVFLAGSFSDPDSPSGHTIQWDLGDGATVEGGLSPTHAYPDNGAYVATLRVTDAHGLLASDSLIVTVENLPPEVDFFTDPFLPAVNEVVTFEAIVFDPGSADTHTLTWDFGDGSAQLIGADLVVSHVYLASGDYPVSLTVEDDDGGVGAATFDLTVGGNQPPDIDFGTLGPLQEGVQFTHAVALSDPDSTSWTAVVDFGDGSAPANHILPKLEGFELVHTYPQDGEFTISLRLSDAGGATSVGVLEVTVENVLPALDLPSSADALQGEPWIQAGSFSDPGADPWAATVDYGDGGGPDDLEVTGKTFRLEHVYNEDGDFVVTVCVSDDDGQSCQEVLVAVGNLPPVVSAQGGQIDEGATADVSASFTDEGAQDVHAAVIDWGDGSLPESVLVDQGTGSGSLTAGHVYGDNGDYDVEVTVTDNHGGVGLAGALVHVDNLAPSVELEMAAAVETAGGPVFLGRAGVEQTHTANAADAGSDDLSFEWSFGPESTYFNDGIGPDPAQSPGGVFPFNSADTAATTFSAAGMYGLSVTVADDDGGATDQSFTKLVTGRATCTQGLGFWKHQFSVLGAHQIDNTTLLAYLGVIDHASALFSERVAASTLAQARALLNAGGPRMRSKAQAHLLAAWLNFAHGSVGWDELIDTDRNGTPDTPLRQVFAQAEAILLDASASHQQLVRAKDLAEAVNSHDPLCEPEAGDKTLVLQQDPAGACLLLNLSSRQFLWSTAQGSLYSGQFTFVELGGRLLFLGTTTDPGLLLGVVTTRGRTGTARLLVEGDVFGIIDPNIDNNRPCP